MDFAPSADFGDTDFGNGDFGMDDETQVEVARMSNVSAEKQSPRKQKTGTESESSAKAATHDKGATKKKPSKKRRAASERESVQKAKELGRIMVEEEALATGVRRSKRQRMKPLEFWKGETVEYERRDDEIGSIIPTMKGVVRLGAPTPVVKQKKRSRTTKTKKKKSKENGKEKETAASKAPKVCPPAVWPANSTFSLL